LYGKDVTFYTKKQAKAAETASEMKKLMFKIHWVEFLTLEAFDGYDLLF